MDLQKPEGLFQRPDKRSVATIQSLPSAVDLAVQVAKFRS